MYSNQRIEGTSYLHLLSVDILFLVGIFSFQLAVVLSAFPFVFLFFFQQCLLSERLQDCGGPVFTRHSQRGRGRGNKCALLHF